MSTSANPSIDDIKKYLKQFSRFLRRDFLAILVKMTARELTIKTVRCDWRTRKGMLAFLQTHWTRFTNLVNSDTIFHWYTHNFESSEKLLENRKLMMFIFANWSHYSNFLQTKEALQLLRAHQNELQNFATSSIELSAEWTKTETGHQMIELINEFKNGLVPSAKVPIQVPTKPQMVPVMQPPQQIIIPQRPPSIIQPVSLSPFDEENEIVSLKNEESNSPKEFSQESSSSEGLSEYDDIIIEDSLDIFPFELSIYDTKDYLHMYPIGDPLIIDEYAI